jgi:predicted nucleic acid-binding protein
MERTKAILDTSVLICLYQLDLVEHLQFFYNKVRIPRKVEEEFLTGHKDELEKSNRYNFITTFYSKHHTWFEPCTDYSADLIAIYLTEKGIDAGEAEVFAQNQVLGNDHIILLDENPGRKLAKTKSIEHHGVLYILAVMDSKFKVCDYWKSIRILEGYGFRLNDAIVNKVWDEINTSF